MRALATCFEVFVRKSCCVLISVLKDVAENTRGPVGVLFLIASARFDKKCSAALLVGSGKRDRVAEVVGDGWGIELIGDRANYRGFTVIKASKD